MRLGKTMNLVLLINPTANASVMIIYSICRPNVLSQKQSKHSRHFLCYLWHKKVVIIMSYIIIFNCYKLIGVIKMYFKNIENVAENITDSTFYRAFIFPFLCSKNYFLSLCPSDSTATYFLSVVFRYQVEKVSLKLVLARV